MVALFVLELLKVLLDRFANHVGAGGRLVFVYHLINLVEQLNRQGGGYVRHTFRPTPSHLHRTFCQYRGYDELLLCPRCASERLRLRIIRVKIPSATPAIIDSTGNPGIPPPTTLDVTVDVIVDEVTERKVEVTARKVEIEVEVVIAVVDVDTVDAIIDVEVETKVVVTDPPKDANLSIVDSAFVEIVV